MSEPAPGLLVRALFGAARVVGRQRWLRLGVRRRIVTPFFPPSSSPALDFEIDFRGWRYRGNVGNTLDWHIYFFGGYELRELDLMDDIAAAIPELVALDVGANLGGHSLSLARTAKQVHAFEPFPPLADRIESQIRLNGIDNITVHRLGLADVAEEKPYYLNQSSRNLGTGSFLESHNHSAQAATLRLERGDDVLAGLSRLDLIKVDVEGYEPLVLTGLRETLAAHHPVIIMEITASTSALLDNHGGLARIIPFDFSVYRIAAPRHRAGLFPSGSYSLRRLDRIVAEKSSFNVLIVPVHRASQLQRLTERA